jgi:hypothetical protein
MSSRESWQQLQAELGRRVILHFNDGELVVARLLTVDVADRVLTYEVIRVEQHARPTPKNSVPGDVYLGSLEELESWLLVEET